MDFDRACGSKVYEVKPGCLLGLRVEGSDYMFADKISVSQAHLCKISTKDLLNFYNNNSLQRAFGYISVYRIAGNF